MRGTIWRRIGAALARGASEEQACRVAEHVALAEIENRARVEAKRWASNEAYRTHYAMHPDNTGAAEVSTDDVV